MDAAVASLLGAVAGGSATFLGTVISNLQQSRRDERMGKETQKAEAYGNALRNLLRAAHWRSSFTSSGEPALGEEQVSDWFSALVEAEYWVTILTAVCGSAYRGTLVTALDKLSAGIDDLLQGPGGLLGARKLRQQPATQLEPGGLFWQVYKTVANVARADLGKPIGRSAWRPSASRPGG